MIEKQARHDVALGLLVLIMLVGLPIMTVAQDPAEPAPAELEPVVVVASKAARPLSDVAGQVSVIRAEDIERQLVEDLDTLFRYEPGVEAVMSGTRFGVSGINIRGIGGNRVAMEVDGVPVRDGFAVGSYSNGGRALIETARVKRLEILHGPASTLYGSDALGGVLAFTTFDPDDLTAFGDGQRWLAGRAAYRGADDSHTLTGQLAWTAAGHGLMLTATRRDGHEMASAAVPAGQRDRQDWQGSDIAARYTFDTAGGHRLRLSAEGYERDTTTDVQSLLGYGRFRSTTGLVGDDQDESRQILADLAFSSDWIDQGMARLFYTNTETRQLTLEERAAAIQPVRLERYFQYATELGGMEFNLFRDIDARGSQHRLGGGVEFLRTRTSEFRDGFQASLVTGEVSRTVLGETLPVRDFPKSVTDEFGLFIQDEIQLGRDWQLIPALRYERYRLDPRTDAIFEDDNPSVAVVAVDEDRWNPRLGVVYQIDEDWSAYGQYVEGFRAPPFEDANIGLDIPLFRVRAIPNPDLKSETSKGFEFGLRRLASSSRFSLALFDTDYEQFIESRALLGFDPDSGYLLFQSRNISNARIYGLDARFTQDLAAWHERLRGWRLETAAYWSRGENEDNGQPLNSVSPPQAIFGLAWASPTAAWEAGLTGTFTARQDRIDSTGGERFAPPGHGVLDLTAGWRINRHVALRGGVFNLTDKTYWRWNDIAKLTADDPMIPLLARPGRNYSLSASFSW